MGGPWLQHFVSAVARFLRHKGSHPSSSLPAGRLAWQLWGWLHRWDSLPHDRISSSFTLLIALAQQRASVESTLGG